MDNYPGVCEAGEEVMLEIVLHYSKKDNCLFQFKKKLAAVPCGELGQYHMGLGVPPCEPPHNAPPQDALPQDALPREVPPWDALPQDALPHDAPCQAPLQKERLGYPLSTSIRAMLCHHLLVHQRESNMQALPILAHTHLPPH